MTMMCVDVQDVYKVRSRKQRGAIGKKASVHHIGLWSINIHHPYKPLVVAIRKLQAPTNKLVQVAWNFVNDG
jgi:hypothetical protein